ncbi:MAG: hypothetical protein ABI587_16710 [Gemmatimonadales bacterium]
MMTVAGLLLTWLPGGRADRWSGWRDQHCGGTVRGGPHPDPRPGITGEKVLTADKLAGDTEMIDLFDKVREIPQIADGIRCQCGCSDPPTFYSLLSCYEGEGMARFCEICQGQARLTYRMHSAGKSLDEIRAGIDARFGARSG